MYSFSSPQLDANKVQAESNHAHFGPARDGVTRLFSSSSIYTSKLDLLALHNPKNRPLEEFGKLGIDSPAAIRHNQTEVSTPHIRTSNSHNQRSATTGGQHSPYLYFKQPGYGPFAGVLAYFLFPTNFHPAKRKPGRIPYPVLGCQTGSKTAEDRPL